MFWRSKNSGMSSIKLLLSGLRTSSLVLVTSPVIVDNSSSSLSLKSRHISPTCKVTSAWYRSNLYNFLNIHNFCSISWVSEADNACRMSSVRCGASARQQRRVMLGPNVESDDNIQWNTGLPSSAQNGSNTHTHTYTPNKGRNRKESKSSPYVTSWMYRRRYVGLKSSIFCDVTQPRMVDSYRWLGTAYRSILHFFENQQVRG